MTTDQASAIAEALWGIAAAITASGPEAPQLTLNTTKGYGPTANPNAFRPALELLPIGAVAELDEPIMLNGPEAEGYGIPPGVKISRVEKHRHELIPGQGSGFELYDGDDDPWRGSTSVVLEMGLSARDFSLPEADLQPYIEKICETVSESAAEAEDVVNEPDHYKLDGRECIELVRSLPFVWGNVVKYVWRFRHKNGLEDLHKARRYLEIAREESIRRPESMENYEFFLKLFYEHDSADEVGEQRLYVLRQIFVPLEYEHETETVEQELDHLIKLVEGEA